MAVRESFTDTVTPVRAVSDAIYNIDFQEAMLLQLLGFGSNNLSKIQVKGNSWPSTKLEWLEDVNVPFTSLLAASGLDGSQTDPTVTTSTGKYFRKGDILGIYPTGTTTGTFQEKILVTGVSGDVLTVERGYGSTSATAAAAGTGVRLITRAMPENHIYTTEHITTPTAPHNFTQILDAAVEMSRTELRRLRYGIDDHMDMQIAKLFNDSGKEGRLAQLLHQTFFFGERVERGGADYGSMGGFDTYVDASKASANHVFSLGGNALQRKDIHRVLRAVRNANGRVTHLVTGAWGIDKIRALWDDKVQVTQEERVLGSPEVDFIRTPHGQVRLVYDWMCPEDRYYFLNVDKCGWVPYDEFRRKTVYDGEDNSPYDGRVEKVVGEYTFFLANAKSFGLISNVSTNK